MSGFNDAAATWNQRFQAAEGYLFGTEPNQFLREQAHRWAPGAKVLCVADGEGRNSVWLAQQGLRVDAFDVSDVAVRKARALAQSAGARVDYAVADVDQWHWPEATYEGIAAIFVQFADPEMRVRLFANMARALAPGGILVLQGYTPRQLQFKTGGPGIESHLYTAEMLRHAFGSLHLLELRQYDADLHEGTHHSGRSALIGLVAQRP
jgi:SAM-dependent methyltransferase